MSYHHHTSLPTWHAELETMIWHLWSRWVSSLFLVGSLFENRASLKSLALNSSSKSSGVLLQRAWITKADQLLGPNSWVSHRGCNITWQQLLWRARCTWGAQVRDHYWCNCPTHWELPKTCDLCVHVSVSEHSAAILAPKRYRSCCHDVTRQQQDRCEAANILK